MVAGLCYQDTQPVVRICVGPVPLTDEFEFGTVQGCFTVFLIQPGERLASIQMIGLERHQLTVGVYGDLRLTGVNGGISQVQQR